jgi:hypothetical protein
VVPVEGGRDADYLAVAQVQDATGALPLVIYPPVYAHDQALIVAETPVIITATAQLAEAWEGRGARTILIAKQVLAYQVEREAREIDVTPIKRRGAAPGTAPAPTKKAAPDPLQYSVGGQRYFTAPAPAVAAPAAPGPVEGQVVITLPPLHDEQEDETRMRRLKEIVVRHPGPTGLWLYLPDDPTVGGPTYMPIKRTVAASDDFCAEVEALLGAGCLTLGDAGSP